MISHGCVIDGTVEHSILSPGVRVARGATVRDSIVMFDAVIGDDAVLDRAIVDKEATIGAGARWASATTCARIATSRSASTPASPWSASVPGVPRGVEIGRNCRIDPGVTEGDFGQPPADRLRRDASSPAPRRGERGSVAHRRAGWTRSGSRWSAARAMRADAALQRDVIVDGERRFDLRVTVAWVDRSRLLAVGILWPRGDGDPEANVCRGCSAPTSTIHS